MRNNVSKNKKSHFRRWLTRTAIAYQYRLTNVLVSMWNVLRARTLKFFRQDDFFECKCSKLRYWGGERVSGKAKSGRELRKTPWKIKLLPWLRGKFYRELFREILQPSWLASALKFHYVHYLHNSLILCSFCNGIILNVFAFYDCSIYRLVFSRGNSSNCCKS